MEQFDSWCASAPDGESTSHKFLFSIEQFSRRKECDLQFIESTQFALKIKNKKIKWILQVYPAKKSDLMSHVVVKLLKDDYDSFTVTANFDIFILDKDNNRVHEQPSSTIQVDGKRAEASIDLIRRSLLLASEYQLLPGDCLRIGCDIMILQEYKLVSSQNSTAQLEMQDRMVYDFKNMYEDGLLADCKIICGDEIFPCHRAILAARSEVFKAMLSSEWEESSTSSIEISDLSSETIENTLEYIYTGQIELHYNPLDLYKAAHKYLLEDLKTWCEDKMCGSINADNVVERLVLAVDYQMSRLKKFSVSFAARNWDTVKNGGDWLNATKNAEFSAEVFPEIISNLS